MHYKLIDEASTFTGTSAYTKAALVVKVLPLSND